MRLLAIDPGAEQSAWVLLDNHGVKGCGIEANDPAMRTRVCHTYAEYLVIEMPTARGQRAGDPLFATCRWVGRFEELWLSVFKADSILLVSRQDVVFHFCGKRNVPGADAALRQILLDRYGPGKDKAVGTKTHPGPLYGVKKDIWQALAVGVYTLERFAEERFAQRSVV